MMEYRIKELLKGRNMSISEFADIINVKRESLSRIVNGASTSVETLQSIANALNVPISDLFDQPSKDIVNCPHCGGKIKIGKD